MNNPILSVITTCYNSSSYIKSAILSVLQQTDERVELILVDDFSTDDTYSVCRPYLSERVRYVKSKLFGAAHARKLGFSLARGAWVAMLDSDDLYLTGSLNDSLFAKLMKYQNDGIDVIYCPKATIDFGLSGTPTILFPEARNQVKNGIPRLELWCSFYRASFLRDKNVESIDFFGMEYETVFRFRAFTRGKTVVDDSLFFYLQRENQNSVSRTWNYSHICANKAMLFYVLSNREQNQERIFLLNVCVSSSSEFFYHVLRFDFFTDRDLFFVHMVLKKILKMAHGNSLVSSIILPRKKLRLLNYFWWMFILWPRKRKARAASNKVIIAREDSESVIARLGEISESILLNSRINSKK